MPVCGLALPLPKCGQLPPAGPCSYTLVKPVLMHAGVTHVPLLMLACLHRADCCQQAGAATLGAVPEMKGHASAARRSEQCGAGRAWQGEERGQGESASAESMESVRRVRQRGRGGEALLFKIFRVAFLLCQMELRCMAVVWGQRRRTQLSVGESGLRSEEQQSGRAERP